jgi:hypothetical protein
MPKTKRHRHPTELQRRMPHISDEHGTRRVVALLFGFYRRCENGDCRRSKKCVGKDASCFAVFWPALPEIRKDLFREAIKAQAASAKTIAEVEAVVFPKIMARYTPEQIYEAAAQLAKGG